MRREPKTVYLFLQWQNMHGDILTYRAEAFTPLGFEHWKRNFCVLGTPLGYGEGGGGGGGGVGGREGERERERERERAIKAMFF